MKNILIPTQNEGKHMDIRSETILNSVAEAEDLYQSVKIKLYDVNNWEMVCGSSITHFELTLANGAFSDQVKEGNLIKIDVLGPGTIAGKGYDWVHIEKIAHSGEQELNPWTGFRVRPCANPREPELGIAHFFDELASSTFMVGRTGRTVWASMHGRNEILNTHAHLLIDRLRNGLVGLAAKIGLSHPQWKLLVKGLVKKQA